MLVQEYTQADRAAVETFREQTFAEGNQSLAYEKFNPDSFDGKIWLVYLGEKIISLSAVESSHYTGDPDVAARICRYHILKEHRHSHCGFQMLEQQIQWALSTDRYKLLYFTHDIHNKALNAMYQHRRRMLDKDAKQWFDADWYQRVYLDRTRLFRVSEKSDFLQYVYRIDIEPGYVWTPARCMIEYSHDGMITATNAEIIQNS